MKILVVSDTHGAIPEHVVETMKMEGKIDAIIHCGDKYDDVLKLARMMDVSMYYRVAGNCDYDKKSAPTIINVELEGKSILITHGHLDHVKDGLTRLKEKAKENDVDIVLFGHTHIAYEAVEDNILYFNPGSPVISKDGRDGFGIIDISMGKIKSKIVKF